MMCPRATRKYEKNLKNHHQESINIQKKKKLLGNYKSVDKKPVPSSVFVAQATNRIT